MKIKRFIVALALCLALALSAFALVGCGEDKLKDAYDAYAASMTEAGQTPLSYDEWVASITKAPEATDAEASLKAVYAEYANKLGAAAIPYEDWKAAVVAVAGTGNSVYLNEAGEIVVSFTNGTERVVKMPVIRTVKAVDNLGNPVIGAYVSVYDYTGRNAVASGVTDDNGEISLSFVEEEGVTYYAFASQEDDLPSGTYRPSPSGYTFDSETALLTDGEFVDGVGTVKFVSMPEHVLYNDHVQIEYSVFAQDGGDDEIIRIEENATPQDISVSANRRVYLDFDPKSNEGEISPDIAASGRYTITFAASNGRFVVSQYEGTEYLDANGIPTDIVKDVYSTANEPFKFELFDSSEKEISFFVRTEEDTTLTVTVERTADARTFKPHPTEPTKAVLHEEDCTGDTYISSVVNFANAENGYSTAAYDFPFDFDDYGICRVGGEDGVIIYVDTKAISPFIFSASDSAFSPSATAPTLSEFAAANPDKIVATETVDLNDDDYLFTQSVNYSDVLVGLNHCTDNYPYHVLTEDILAALQAVDLTGTGYKHGNAAPGREWLLACSFPIKFSHNRIQLILPSAANESDGVYEQTASACSYRFEQYSKLTFPAGVGCVLVGENNRYVVDPASTTDTVIIVKPDNYSFTFSTTNKRSNAYTVSHTAALPDEYMLTEGVDYFCEIGVGREDNGTETDYSDDTQLPESIELNLTAGTYKLVIGCTYDGANAEMVLNQFGNVGYNGKYFSSSSATPTTFTFARHNDGTGNYTYEATFIIDGTDTDYIELYINDNAFAGGGHFPNVVKVTKVG